MSRCRSRSRADRAFYLDDPEAALAPSRCRRKARSKKGKSKCRKQERKPVRQPYINTCLSIPYVSSKFKR